MKLAKPLKFALSGWVAGAGATLILGLLWPIIIPAIVRVNHYYGVGPNLATIIMIVLVVITPAALVGGLIGSRLPREGGQSEQMLVAGVFGILLAMPFACYGLWFFTGF
jgi:hypothetical protein